MRLTLRSIQTSLALGAAVWFAIALTHAAPVADGQVVVDAGFPSNRLVRIQIDIPDAAAERLRVAPRNFVRATLREGTNTFENVALRLKGRSGSFRALDDKPSFTIDMERFVPDRTFAGTVTFHLNNSVEDPSFLRDWLGSETVRAAAIPAPRVTHAWVELNGRSLGLYMLREGFDAKFLARSFGHADGNLYEPEPGPGADVTGPMRLSSGSGVKDRSDLNRLASAAMAGDLTERAREFNATLDVDRFLTFIAMEILLSHRDGYALARNNYRLYRNPGDGRFVFMPGSMDNLLGRADAALTSQMAGTVAVALMEIPEWRRAYRERLGTLFTNHLQGAALGRMLRERAELIARELPRADATNIREQASLLIRHLEERANDISRQLAIPERSPLVFVGNVAVLEGWQTFGVPKDGVMREIDLEGVPAFHVRSTTPVASSWRMQVWLPSGRYRFEAKIKTRAVEPLPRARTSGLYLNVPGQKVATSNPLVKDQDWTRVSTEFELEVENSSVELQCVFRAASGEAWFDRRSLQLVRVSR